MSAARARPDESADFSNCAAISSCSRRPRFWESFQRVSRRETGISKFTIPVARLETRWKLSQNRGRREQELIAAALGNSVHPMDRALAELTRKHYVEE